LRSIKYGEADIILTLLGCRTGKISAIAKGARKPKSRMRGTVQLFNYGNYLLYRGKSFYTVTQCETKEPFTILREDLLKFAYASYIAELLTEVLPEEEINTGAFILLISVLNMIAKKEEILAVRLFDAKLLKLAGYQPQLTACVACGGRLDENIVFSAREGGVLCSGCSKNFSAGVPVKKGTLAVLSRLAGTDLKRAERLKIGSTYYDEMEKLLEVYWEYILEKRLKSLDFIKTVRSFE